MTESVPRDTPEQSQADDQHDQESASKSAINPALKDRRCQYCGQAFTSSSLGRHLDQFLFKKKPDGIHDVEEIRRIRSGITRRQARTSSGKRDGSPDQVERKGPPGTNAPGSSASKSRDAPVRMMFNTPTWHATGVINDIPNPSRTTDGPRIAPAQSRAGSLQLPDFASRGAIANNPDTMKALELALREVLDNIKAATYVAFRLLSFGSYPIIADNAIIVPVSDHAFHHSTSRSKPRLSPPFVYSFSLLPQACSPLIPSRPRPHFHSNHPAGNTSTLFARRFVPKSHNGDPISSPRTRQYAQGMLEALLTIP